MTFFIEKDEEIPAEYWPKRSLEIMEVQERENSLLILYTCTFTGWDQTKVNKLKTDRFYITDLGQKVDWKDCDIHQLNSLIYKDMFFREGSLEREALRQELGKLTNVPLYKGNLELYYVGHTLCVKEVTTE